MAYVKRGIDISKYQGCPDFAKLKKAGVSFVIIRAGFGKRNIDPQLEHNIRGCVNNGIPFGFYWFSYAFTVEMAKDEARFLLEAIGECKPEYPLYFDFEYASLKYAEKNGVKITSKLCEQMATAFCDVLEKNGYFAGVYCDVDFEKAYYKSGNVQKRFSMWLASYKKGSVAPNGCDMWQYSSQGQLYGINGFVDLNYCYRDFPKAVKYNILNNWANTPFVDDDTVVMNGRAIKIQDQIKSKMELLKKHGCGFFCAESILNYYGVLVSAVDCVDVLDNLHGCENRAVSINGIQAILREFGLKNFATKANNNRKEIAETLERCFDNGNPAIIYVCNKSVLNSGDHYVVAVGRGVDGKILVLNSGTSKRIHTVTLDELLDAIKFDEKCKLLDSGWHTARNRSNGILYIKRMV